jgi:glycine hydroxymethyltransferase
MPYKVDVKSGLIDYDALEQNAQLFRPQIIVAGMLIFLNKIYVDYCLV